MFWNDDKDRQPAFVISDEVVDLAYRIGCPTLPLDHAHSLSSALLQALPWLADEETAGVHLIHGAASGNGWFRPEDTENELLHLSRRTRMRLRVPKNRLQDARALSGQTLDIEGHPLEIGKSEVFMLSSLPTLFSRYVLTQAEHDETQFLEDAANGSESYGYTLQENARWYHAHDEFSRWPVVTRSLMVADLEPEQSVRLQQTWSG